MAGIDNLKERILSENREMAREIEKEAALKSDEILRNARLQAEKILGDVKARAERDGRDKKDRIIARAHLDARNTILTAKQEVIDMTMRHVSDKIEAMNEKEYSVLLETMLLNSAETGQEEVIFSERDRGRIDNDLITNANRSLKALGKRGDLKLSSERRKISSGFILKRGGLEINCSIEAQIRILRDSLEGEIADILFEKETS